MSFHGYSEDEESPILANFVNDTMGRQEQTPSPRTELLSPTSAGPLLGEVDRVLERGPSERFRRQRELAYANYSSNNLLSLLIEREYECRRLRKGLHSAFDRFEAQAVRAAEAERVTQEALDQFRIANVARITAERALEKTSEELRLWKFQFDHAQGEIARAQEVVKLVETQRDDAEQAAARTRKLARQLNEHRLVSDALEEGRKLGYKAGLRRAQQELALGRNLNPAEMYDDFERDPGQETAYSMFGTELDTDRLSRLDSPRPQPHRHREIDVPPVLTPRSPITTRMPEAPVSAPAPRAHAEEKVSMPVPTPAVAMPTPIPASPSRSFAFETESVRRPPLPQSARSPSIEMTRYSIDIPSASVFNEPQPGPSRQHQRRPSQAQPVPAPPAPARAPPPTQQRVPAPQARPPFSGTSQGILPRSPQTQAPSLSHRRSAQGPELHVDIPRRRPTPQEPSPQHHPPPVIRPPDNYIPSASPDGDIPLPPPFQLSQPMPSGSEVPRTQSWYSREQEPQPQVASWYQGKRPRSNAGSVTGRSAVGSVAARSQGRHTRQASLDSRVLAGMTKSQRLAAEYRTDLGDIREDARSAHGSQRARSMRGSTESLVPPPPLPEKDARHRKQMIADELRYSNPDLPDAWRRNAAAAKTNTASSKGQPPRNVRVPVNLTFPTPLSPPTAPVPLTHMRARSMSASTGKSGWTQQPQPVEVGRGPSLRRVKDKRPVSPSEMGSPYFGMINVQPPSQSSSQVPLATVVPQMDQYLSPNYRTQPLPTAAPSLPTGFVPQSVTVPASITVPISSVMYKGKPISSPIEAQVALPTASPAQPRSRASSLSRPGGAEPTPVPVPVSAPVGRPASVMSNSGLSHKSGRSGAGKGEYAFPVLAGPTLEPGGPTLAHRGSTTSLRSNNSYARFDAQSYVDPAYYAADGLPVPVPRSRKGSASSRHSGLSYMGPPGP